HVFIFWGFIVLLPTIAEAAIAIVDKESSFPILGHTAWFAFLSDVFATLVVVGIAMAFFIRKVLKPDRFRGSHMEEADRILLLILAFLVFLPGSKHLHIATAPANVWLAKDGPTGRLEPNRIDLELPEEDIRFGVATQKDLSKKQMLDLFSCTECGRCQEACPAWATGKPLSPKLLIMDLRDRVVAEAAGEVEL